MARAMLNGAPAARARTTQPMPARMEVGDAMRREWGAAVEDERDFLTDGEDWSIPADRGHDDIDPWAGVLDEWAEETEHRYQYPAGLP
jgi:hypothetical protein